MNIILSVLMTYPSATIWLLLGAEQSEEPFIKDRISVILNRAQVDKTNIMYFIITHIIKIYRKVLKLHQLSK